MEGKITKICNSFNGTTFSVKLEGIDQKINECQQEKEHARDIIKSTKRAYKDYLTAANTRGDGEVSVIKIYKLFILKERAIYTHLNMLENGEAVGYGLIWVPRYYKFEEKMNEMKNNTQLNIMHGLSFEKGPDDIKNLNKPTYFRLNEFTWVFQEIVDTYGVPGYKEINPAVFTCVSFPFLFGVMFGDILHGTWLTVFAIYIVMTHKEGS